MKKALLSLALVTMSLAANAETSLHVVYLDSEEQSYELSKVQYIDFRDADNFTVVGKDGSTLNSSEYSKTRRIDFNSEQNKAITEQANAKVKVYPNPTQDALNITGIEENSNISIMDYQGKVLYNVKASGSELQVPVSSYANGTYLIKIGGKVVKFIKE